MASVNKHVERSERTRAALVAAARPLFAEHGYAAVAAEDVARRAGVTRGALTHQFGGKRELFRTVVEQVEAELAERVAAAALEPGSGDPVDGLARGAEVFLDACLEPEVQQITLVDAPAVLGWEAWRNIGEGYGLGLVQAALEGAMEAGALDRVPVEPLAHLLLGALDEAGLYVAGAADVTVAREESGRALRRLLEGLRAPPPSSSGQVPSS